VFSEVTACWARIDEGNSNVPYVPEIIKIKCHYYVKLTISMIFTLVPCILNLLKFFIYSLTNAVLSCRKNIKIYIKIYIKTAPTYFGVTDTPSSGSALINVLPDDDVNVTPKHVGAVLM